jgi:hypothetical protein
MTVMDEEMELLRRMTPEQKVAVMHRLIGQAYELKTAALRARRPGLRDEEIRALVRLQVGGECP